MERKKPSHCEGYLVEKKGLTFGFSRESLLGNTANCLFSPGV